MTISPRPAALDLPDQANVRWTSLTKVLREPERNWPAQICERGMIAGRLGRTVLALTADPDAARAILASPSSRFAKWRIYERVVGAGVGRNNISVTEGETCQRQRRAFSPLFRPETMPDLAPLFGHAAARAVGRWREPGGPLRIDAGLEMTRITLDIIWRLVFGAAVDAPVRDAVDRVARQVYAAQIAGRINEPSGLFEGLVQDAAREPQPGAGLRANPLAGLGQPALPGGLSAAELYDNARLFLSAGHETTALTLTWALWLTGRDRALQDRLHAEIDVVTKGEPVGHEHLDRLTLTGQAVNETLRLFPTAPIVVRRAQGEETLCGETLPPGAIWAVCIYALHRHKTLWADPDGFDLDRFAPGSDEPRHRFAYLPFGAGRHVCIGAPMAWTETMSVFAAILQAFDLQSDPTIEIGARMAITLRPDRETPILLTPR